MANQPLKLDVTIDPIKVRDKYICDDVIAVLKLIRPEWCTDESILTKLKALVFQEGLCNHMYGYYQDGKFKEDVVVFRIYGHNTEMTIDREAEIQTMQIMGDAGLCAPVYVVFNNGIVYGYAQGTTLDEDTVRDEKVKRLIAQEIIKMHRLTYKGKEKVTELWDKMYSLLELSPESFEDPNKHKVYQACIKPKQVLRQELDALKSHIEDLVPASPVVFCHNDLLLKNIIYNEEKGTISFIDFEYAFYNYEHFELANHFCEFADLTNVDFNRYPSRDYQMEWLRYYLEEKSIQHGGEKKDVTEKDVETCYVMTNKFALSAHMFWGLSCLIHAKFSSVDFNFIGYAHSRFEEYFAKKEEFLSLQCTI